MRRSSLGWLLTVLVVVRPDVSIAQDLLSEVRGTVVDGSTLEPISGARVTSADRSTSTDTAGRFVIALAPGVRPLTISATGYFPTTLAVTLVAESNPPLEVLLFSRSLVTETVNVAGQIPREETPSTITVQPRHVLEAAGSIDNVFRTLATLPGVAATDDFGSRLSVRGGSPDQNLTLMDGVEIHNPFRLFGLASAFNPETIARFDLKTGGFSSKYGDRLSSLLVIETRDGADDFGGSATTSITDANIVVEGATPGPGDGSFLFAGRRTYFDLIANRVTGQNFPSFADLQIKAAWTLGQSTRITLTGLTSREDSDFTIDERHDTAALLSDIGNDLVSARVDALLGDRATSTTIVSWYRNREFIDFAGSFRQEAKRSNAPDDDIAFGQADFTFERAFELRDFSVRQEITIPLGTQHVMDVGAELHQVHSGMVFTIVGDRNISQANGSSIAGGVGLPDTLDSTLNGTRSGLWVQDRWQASDRFSVEPGLRMEWSTANDDGSLLPRLGASYELTPTLRLRGAVGLFTQSPGYEKLIQSDYFIDLSNARALGLRHEEALHAIAGVETDLGWGTLFRVEAYYKRFDRLIVGRLESDAERTERLARYDFPDELQDSIPTQRFITSNPSNDGRGRAYGFDVFLSQADPSRRMTGWLSYTWGQARQDAYDQRYPFDYDRRHAFTAVGRYRLTDSWDIAGTGRVASGFTRTSPVGLRVATIEDERGLLIPETDAEGRLVYAVDLGDVSNLNRGRLPHYARVDLRATYRRGGLTGRWSFYIEVINLLGRDNPVAIEPRLVHDPTAVVPRITEVASEGFPLIPTFGFRVRF